MTRKKGQSRTEDPKTDWSTEKIKTVVAILLDDKIKWIKWFKTTQSWAMAGTQDYDKNWAAVLVLSDLNVSDCYQSRDQFLAYLKTMINVRVGPFGARDPKRFEQSRVAYIQQLIAHYDV